FRSTQPLIQRGNLIFFFGHVIYFPFFASALFYRHLCRHPGTRPPHLLFHNGRRGKPRLYGIFYNPGMKRVVHAACPHDYPDACGVLITIEDGRATKIQGDPEHPVTRGFLCAKVAKYLDRVYSPDRVLYRMRRVKPKGPGYPREGRAGAPVTPSTAFERISWDEALDEIAHRL